MASLPGFFRSTLGRAVLRLILAVGLGAVLFAVWGGLFDLQLVRSSHEASRQTRLAAQGVAAGLDASFARFAEQMRDVRPRDLGPDRVAQTSRLLRLQTVLPPGSATFSVTPDGQLMAASSPFTPKDSSAAGLGWFASAEAASPGALVTEPLDHSWLGVETGVVLSRLVSDPTGKPVGVIGAVVPQARLAALATPAWLAAGITTTLLPAPIRTVGGPATVQDRPTRIALAALGWFGGSTTWTAAVPLQAFDGTVVTTMTPQAALHADTLVRPALASGAAVLAVWLLTVLALFLRRTGTPRLQPVGFGVDWRYEVDASGMVRRAYGLLPDSLVPDSLASCVGQALAAALGLPAGSGAAAQIAAALRNRTPLELPITLADRLYRVSLAPLAGGGFSCSGRDVSELMAAQDERDAAVASEATARRQQERLLISLGHDIRTPMTSIMGICELLLDGELEPEVRTWLERAQSSCGALLGMLNGLLDAAGDEVGGGTLLREPVDVAALVQEVAEVLRPQARDKGLELRVRCDDLLRGQWLVDSGRLRQLVFNLASNAVKFTPSGRVEIRASAVEADGQSRLRIAVADTGPGIDPSEREHIFERFRRGRAQEGTNQGGLGLGLALCRDNAVLMDGGITLESALGVGSEFTFECPAERVPAADRKLPFAGRTALIVADDAPATRSVAAQLGELGLMVETAPDGYLGLALAERLEAQRGALDLVVLQASLAGMPGEVFARRLRGTAFGRRSVLLWVGPAAGGGEVDATLPAPPDPYEIASTARQLLAERPALDALEPNLSLARRGRVLLVEDDKANQALLAAALSRRGFAVFTAGNGEEAVRLAGRDSFDAILMDLQMPGVDGFEATQRIRGLFGHAAAVPIVALTALLGTRVRQRCKDAGFSAVLEKPVNLDGLTASLHRLIGDSTRGTAPVDDATSYVADVSVAFLEEMVAVVGIDRARACIAEFITEATARCRRLGELLPGWEVEAILRSCEEISGMAETCGALALGELLEEIADTASRDDRNAMEALIARLDMVIARLPPAMTSCLDDVARRWSRNNKAA